MTKEQKRLAAEVKRANQEACGIPDSRPFIGDTPHIDEKLLDAHVGGIPVRNMPIEVQGRLLYQQTDEGIAEFNEGKQPRRVELGADQFTKACEERKDSILDRGMEPWEAPNPMSDLEASHVSAGFKGKFLSPAKIDKEGTRGYRVVKHANGEPVKLRNMILGEMPLDRVQARTKHFQEKAAAALGNAKNTYMKEGGQLSVNGET